MFSAIYYTKTEQRDKELSLGFPAPKTELKNSYWFIFYCHFYRQMVEKLCVLFGPHCFLSAYTQDYELKFSTQTNFDTLISHLKFYF